MFESNSSKVLGLGAMCSESYHASWLLQDGSNLPFRRIQVRVLVPLQSKTQNQKTHLWLVANGSKRLGMIDAKRKGSGGAAGGTSSCSGFGFTIVAAAHANCDSGVTHFGVVGRAVKRVSYEFS
ncbi:hypothetical protein QVD17_17261 [Tagetes erecta]|uniref:Uncharacterized protein n=1 Tax=Tagetes erecta TaxID=13708 RepID=A0AAD8KY22_TARER|nr:hypothetical protein QVD17_17261 [Tagetes erecta]